MCAHRRCIRAAVAAGARNTLAAGAWTYPREHARAFGWRADGDVSLESRHSGPGGACCCQSYLILRRSPVVLRPDTSARSRRPICAGPCRRLPCDRSTDELVDPGRTWLAVRHDARAVSLVGDICGRTSRPLVRARQRLSASRTATGARLCGAVALAALRSGRTSRCFGTNGPDGMIQGGGTATMGRCIRWGAADGGADGSGIWVRSYRWGAAVLNSNPSAAVSLSVHWPSRSDVRTASRRVLSGRESGALKRCRGADQVGYSRFTSTWPGRSSERQGSDSQL